MQRRQEYHPIRTSPQPREPPGATRPVTAEGVLAPWVRAVSVEFHLIEVYFSLYRKELHRDRFVKTMQIEV